MTSRRATLVFGLVAALVAGCSHIIFGSGYSLSVSNDTTIPVTLFVNEQSVSVVEPGRSIMIHASDMPALPWNVGLTTAAGRTLAALPVASGSIVDERALDGTGSYSAPFSRTVLSCGELSIQVGDAAFRGGGLGTGVDGDCNP